MVDEERVHNGLVQSQSRALVLSPSVHEPAVEEREYLHSVLCQVGLPRSATKERVFTRSNGSASMMIEAGRWNDGRRWEEMPLPYGTRPRLVLFHVCSEAKRTGSPEVEVENSVRGFLRKLRISEGGESMASFKKQMRALAACRMQLAYRTGTRVLNVKCDPIEQFDAWMQDEEGQGTMWPGVIRLSQKFFESLQDYAVPLDQRAVASLQNSALALDTYTWLAHRLWRIGKATGQIIHWKSLREQFGQEYKSDKDFKREFLGAMKKAVAVYPEARVEQVRGGVRLLPSAPPVKRRQVSVALPSPAVDEKPLAPQSSSIAASQTPDVPLIDAALLQDAARQIGNIDPKRLDEMYRGILAGRKTKPKDMDADFQRWAKAFAKGRTNRSDGVEPASPVADFVISAAARAKAARVAGGADIAALEERYRAWVAKLGEAPYAPDKAFPAWVERHVSGQHAKRG